MPLHRWMPAFYIMEDGLLFPVPESRVCFDDNDLLRMALVTEATTLALKRMVLFGNIEWRSNRNG